jgi:hypothetical protein
MLEYASKRAWRGLCKAIKPRLKRLEARPEGKPATVEMPAQVRGACCCGRHAKERKIRQEGGIDMKTFGCALRWRSMGTALCISGAMLGCGGGGGSGGGGSSSGTVEATAQISAVAWSASTLNVERDVFATESSLPSKVALSLRNRWGQALSLKSLAVLPGAPLGLGHRGGQAFSLTSL